MKLYEIAIEHQRAITALEQMDDLDESIIDDTMSAISDDFEKKAIGFTYHLENERAEIEAIKEAEGRMKERRQSIEKKLERSKEWLLGQMERTGITEIKCPQFCIKVKKCPPSVCIDDIGELPLGYSRIKYEPDKNLIKSCLLDGYDIPGAHLETDNKRLEIK